MSCCSCTISFPYTITILIWRLAKNSERQNKRHFESSKCVEILKDPDDLWFLRENNSGLFIFFVLIFSWFSSTSSLANIGKGNRYRCYFMVQAHLAVFRIQNRNIPLPFPSSFTILLSSFSDVIYIHATL